MRVETSFLCLECHHKHPIEFRVQPNGQIETERTPILDEMFPCLARFKQDAEKINLLSFTPTTMMGKLIVILDATIRCLRPDQPESRIIIENESDQTIIQTMFRNAKITAFLAIRGKVPDTEIESYTTRFVQRLVELNLATPPVVKSITFAILSEIDAPEHSYFARTAIERLIQNPITAEPARQAFQTSFEQTLEDRKQHPYRSIDTNSVIIWRRYILPESPELMIRTLDTLIEYLRIKQEHQCSLNCYWPLRGETVDTAKSLICQTPNKWSRKTLGQIQRKLNQLVRLESKVYGKDPFAPPQR